MTAREEIDLINASEPGKTRGRYRVGTFPNGGRQPIAYLRWYSPKWEGCIEYDVVASSGAAAKKAAIRARAEREGRCHDEDDVNGLDYGSALSLLHAVRNRLPARVTFGPASYYLTDENFEAVRLGALLASEYIEEVKDGH